MTPSFVPSADVNLEHINEPGDVITEAISVTNANGDAFDITNFCVETVLFEDIFSNTMMGHVYVLDAADLINKIPLVGVENITLSFRTPTMKETISKSFKITSVDDRTFTKTDVEQGYTISFISLEAYLDNVTNLSMKFSGKTNELVQKIFKDHLSTKRVVGSPTAKDTEVQTTGKSHGSSASFIACSWSPLKCINWVTNRSFGNAQEAPSFLFFESNKSFKFTSIEELIGRQKEAGGIFAEYVYAPNYTSKTLDLNSQYSYSKPELVKQYGTVRNIAPHSYFNTLDKQDYGYYAGTLITQDYILKTYQEHPFDYFESYGNFKHLGEPSHPTYSSKQARNVKVKNTVRTKSYKLHDDMKDPLYEKWMLQRNTLLYEAGSSHVEVEVAGRTDIEVGVIVNFIYPKAMDKTQLPVEDEGRDKFMSGLYLVTAIRHSFKLNKHTMFLELMKDSVKEPL